MPQSTETTPLVNNNGRANSSSDQQRHGVVLYAEDDPSWASSIHYFFLGSWFNIFLVFVPLSAISHYLNWDAGLRFLFSFLSILPLAKLIGESTDQLSSKLGDTLAGLCNATFGNAVEIIVGVAALLQDQLRIVQTSLLGSILSNLLLVLGCSFFAGGLYYHESNFQVTAAQTSASLMTLACITLVIPAAYRSAKDPQDTSLDGLLTISRGTAILLLIVYAAYLLFQLKTHRDLFESKDAQPETETVKMNAPAAGVCLLAVTILTSFCADYLVASIEETAERYHIPKPFIGLILLPIVSNAAEHVTSVWMAVKGKMELTIGICVGSSIQIASFVVPLLVIIGWIAGRELSLYFEDFETITLFVSVLLVNLLIMDGKSNFMEGLMLITLYIVVAVAFWVS